MNFTRAFRGSHKFPQDVCKEHVPGASLQTRAHERICPTLFGPLHLRANTTSASWMLSPSSGTTGFHLNRQSWRVCLQKKAVTMIHIRSSPSDFPHQTSHEPTPTTHTHTHTKPTLPNKEKQVQHKGCGGDLQARRGFPRAASCHGGIDAHMQTANGCLAKVCCSRPPGRLLGQGCFELWRCGIVSSTLVAHCMPRLLGPSSPSAIVMIRSCSFQLFGDRL